MTTITFAGFRNTTMAPLDALYTEKELLNNYTIPDDECDTVITREKNIAIETELAINEPSSDDLSNLYAQYLVCLAKCCVEELTPDDDVLPTLFDEYFDLFLSDEVDKIDIYKFSERCRIEILSSFLLPPKMKRDLQRMLKIDGWSLYYKHQRFMEYLDGTYFN